MEQKKRIAIVEHEFDINGMVDYEVSSWAIEY